MKARMLFVFALCLGLATVCFADGPKGRGNPGGGGGNRGGNAGRGPVQQPRMSQPQRPNFQPQRPNFQPQRPNIQPQRPNIQPQRPNIQPQRPNIQPQRPNVQPQRPNFQPPRQNVQPPRQQPTFNPGRQPAVPQRPNNPTIQPGRQPGWGQVPNNPVVQPGNPGGRPNNPVVQPGNPKRPDRPDVPVTAPVHNSRPGQRPGAHTPVPLTPPRNVPGNVKPHQVHCVPGQLPANHHHYRPPVVQHNYCAPVHGRYAGRYVPPFRGYNYNVGFWFGGTCYSVNPYFSHAHYCPTQWFYYGSNCWFRPGFGYYYSPPVGFNQTITVVVEETYTEMEWDPFLGVNVPVTKTVTWYYNAYYYPTQGWYGYVDCRGAFHWLQW